MSPFRRVLCSAAGCANVLDRPGRCAAHKQQGGFSRFSRNEAAYQAGWRELRAQVLRDQPVCTICHLAPATQLDHIIPARLGGPSTRDNVRAVCRSCNLRLAAEQSTVVKRAKRVGRG